jgi:hypothetical protein
LIINAVAQCASGNGSNQAANESAGGSVSTSAVVADDGPRERTDGSASDGTLLRVWPGADAS